MTRVSSGVRSLKWKPDGCGVLIGTFEGSLWYWPLEKYRHVFELSSQNDNNDDDNNNKNIESKHKHDIDQSTSLSNEYSNPSPHKVFTTNDVITAMEWQHVPIHNRSEFMSNIDFLSLAIGTTDGKIIIINQKVNDDDCNNSKNNYGVSVVHSFLAHKPVHSNDPNYRDRFGSLHIKGIFI